MIRQNIPYLFEMEDLTLQVQLADADAPHDLGLSSEEAARLQGFLDGSEVNLPYVLPTTCIQYKYSTSTHSGIGEGMPHFQKPTQIPA